MELQELHSYICRQKKPSLMGRSTKLLTRDKEKHHVRKEDYHSSGNERRLQSR